MATQFVTFTMPGYLPDWNALAKDLTVNGRFSLPPALTAGAVNTILAAIGATQKSAAQKGPCPPPSSFKPRRLSFYFQAGGNISVPFKVKADALTIATAIRNALQTDLGPVSCVTLDGEKWGRIDEDLRPAGTTVAAGADIRVTTGSKNPIFTGAYSYLTDRGATSVQTVRQNTNSTATPATPFSIYAAAINSALGPLLPAGCGGVGNVTPRHYIATILTTNVANPIRKLIVPVAANSAASIGNVGVQIATIAQTLCLAYEGESDSRFSRLLA